MEPIAAHAFIIECARQGKNIVHERMPTMEGRVETGDLLHMRPRLARRLDAGNVVRLMQRRERDQAAQIVQHLIRNDGRRGIAQTAMHHAVPGRHHLRIGESRTAPGEYPPQRIGVEPLRLSLPAFLMQHRAGGVVHLHMPGMANPLHRPQGQRFRRAMVERE